jgi:hypothetical protein
MDTNRVAHGTTSAALQIRSSGEDEMGDPIELQDLFFSTMSGAAIVLMGASYALFFALGRLHESRSMSAASTLSYLFLAAAVFVLVDSLSLSGFWMLVAAVMLVGYFLAPRAIWKLCVGTHAAESQPRSEQ